MRIIYICKIKRADEISFEKIKRFNNLNIIFEKYPNIIITLLENCFHE